MTSSSDTETQSTVLCFDAYCCGLMTLEAGPVEDIVRTHFRRSEEPLGLNLPDNIYTDDPTNPAWLLITGPAPSKMNDSPELLDHYEAQELGSLIVQLCDLVVETTKASSTVAKVSIAEREQGGYIYQSLRRYHSLFIYAGYIFNIHRMRGMVFVEIASELREHSNKKYFTMQRFYESMDSSLHGKGICFLSTSALREKTETTRLYTLAAMQRNRKVVGTNGEQATHTLFYPWPRSLYGDPTDDQTA